MYSPKYSLGGLSLGRFLLTNISFFLKSFPKPSSMPITSLPNEKILDWSKLKAFADDKINVNQKLKFNMGKVENIVENGENAGYQHFLLFPQCFQKVSFSGSLKSPDCVVNG